jgi:hypothetical protein
MKIKLLEHYLQQAMAKSKTQHRKISTVLAEAMPEIISELRRMATGEDSDLSTRRWAIDTLSAFWRTLLTASQSENRIAVKRTQTKIRRQRVKVAERQTNLKIHELRATADKKLAAIGGV